MLPESFLQELKERSDIEQMVSSYVHLKRSGRRLVGLCPFHSEKSPSFTVFPDSQSFYCFGCGAGGDVITFLMKAENLEYLEAVKLLAQRAGMTLPEDAADDRMAELKTRILEINRESARFFYHQLTTPEGREGLDYLVGRGLSVKTIRRFGLGYAPNSWDTLGNYLRGKGYRQEELIAAAVVGRGRSSGTYDLFRHRVMFPIIDLRGNVIAFGGRALTDQGPKYLNSSDTPVFKKSRNLFAMNIAKNTKEKSLILAEGYMDVIAIHQGGFDNCVATLGTALTAEQARIMSQYAQEVIVAYDSDAAGQKAAARAINIFGELGTKVRVLKVQDAKDPDEYIKKFGPERFKRLLEGASNAIEHSINRIREKYDLTTADGRVSFLKEFAQYIPQVQNPIERDVYISKIADELSVSKEALTAQVQNNIKRQANSRRRSERRDLRVYSEVQPGHKPNPERSQNIHYALAEDKLIALLCKHPDYYPFIQARIRPEQFVTSQNREIFSLLMERLGEGKSIELIHLSGELSGEQFSWLTWLITSNEGLLTQKEQAQEYIDTILSHGTVKTPEQAAQLSPEQWQEYMNDLKAKKN